MQRSDDITKEDDMNDMNNPAPNAYDVLRDEHTALQTSFAHLSKQVNEVILERCQVSDDLREVRGALRRVNEDLHTAEVERDEARDALAKMSKRFDNLVADCNGTTISLQQERDKNARLEHSANTLVRTIKELEAVIDAKQVEIGAYVINAEQLKKRNADLETLKAECYEDIDALNAEIDALKARDAAGDDDIAALQERIASMRDIIDKLQAMKVMPDHIPTGTDVWVVDTRKVGITRGRILKTIIHVFSDNSTVISYTINGISYDVPSQCVFTDIASAGEYMAKK